MTENQKADTGFIIVLGIWVVFIYGMLALGKKWWPFD